jgi:hypothetical protein
MRGCYDASSKLLQRAAELGVARCVISARCAGVAERAEISPIAPRRIGRTAGPAIGIGPYLGSLARVGADHG